MNENYKWKGTTFNSKGIIIEKTPVIPRANHSYDTYEIPGRSGYLTIDNKTYEPIAFSLECHFKDSNVDINEIRAWLDGYGSLQIDDEKEWTGYISNSIDFEKVVGFQKFIIQFMLQPVAKALTTTTRDLGTLESGIAFVSTTKTNTYPKITLTASGTSPKITINGVSFKIHNADGTYILDCEAKVITKNGVNASSVMSGDFPYIKSGLNNIMRYDDTLTNITLEYKNTYL